MDEEETFDQYDEFGNYIGPEGQEEVSSLSKQGDENIFEEETLRETVEEMVTENQENLHLEEDAIVLYEDKKYYPEIEEIYPNAEIMIEEEDSMAITEPIIKDVSEKKFNIVERNIPKLNFSLEFFKDLMKSPESIRNIAVVGHLHHGKTTLMDVFVEESLQEGEWDPVRQKNYTDSRFDEKERKISTKASPLSLVVQNSRDKSYLLNMMDTPGHTNFVDEACCGLRLADGAVVVVDVIEGMMINTERLIKYIVHEQTPVREV